MKKVFKICMMIFLMSCNLYGTESIEDTNAREISLIVAKSISTVGVDTATGEAIKRITYKLVSMMSKEVLNRFLANKAMQAKVHGYVRDLVRNGGFNNLLKKRINSSFKTELMWIAGDVFVEIVNQAIWKYSTWEQRYTQSLIWWIQIGYVDVKAAINPNKIAAAIDFTLGNGTVLVDMGQKIKVELKTLGKLKWDIKYNQAYMKIMEYELDTLWRYCQADDVNEKNTILSNFKLKCDGEKVFGNIFGHGNKDTFNTRITALKYDALKRIYDFERNKYNALFLMIKNKNKTQYTAYVNNYFPSEIAYFLIINYNYFYDKKNINSVKINSVIFKYSIKALSLGFKLEDFGSSHMSSIKNKDIEKSYVYTCISKAKFLSYRGSYSTYSYDKTIITRKDFAKIMVEELYLKSFLSKADENSIQKLRDNNNKLDKNMLILNKLKIVSGDPSKTDFRNNDNLSRLELLIMIVRAREYIKDNKWRIL